MNLEEVLVEWKIDAVIKEADMLKELFKTPQLHAKYLEYYVYFRAKLASAEKKYNRMSYIRKRYYRGELTKEELDKFEWDQYQGLKMSNSEFNQHSDIDPVLVELKEIVDSFKAAVSVLEYIMKSIASRDWALKSAIDYQKFVNGN